MNISAPLFGSDSRIFWSQKSCDVRYYIRDANGAGVAVAAIGLL